jgi:DNA invertase Pin-like site-specific DNA recombinase
MTRRELPPSVLGRRAVIYVRQSTASQVQENLESQRRQYELAELAQEYGFRDVVVIDEDLGRSASGAIDRPGFRNLVGQICEGVIGAVFCLEASRLSRNGRDWHHLIELCGLVGARVIDADGVYDPSTPNDRLLLGLKGTMSEFELTVLRRRLLDAAIAKARRGELRMPVPVGYVWHRDTGLAMDPDRRVQDAVHGIFRLFDRFGSARQVLLYMHAQELLFPRPAEGKLPSTTWVWRPPVYRNVISVLRNPFYAGAYAYGKSQVEVKIVDGTVQKRYGHDRPRDQWTVLLRDHHDAYIDWDQHEKNQERIASNAFSKRAGGAKSGRGGQALMAGLLRCRRCGRMLHVTYGGATKNPLWRYGCRLGESMHGLPRCISFGARRPDEVIAREILLAVQPLAIEAALVAEKDVIAQADERKRALVLEHEQAKYDVLLATRRYEAVDPNNRLVASELEARWNAALGKLRECEARLASDDPIPAMRADRDALIDVAGDLEAAWTSPTTTMRTKQRLVRALIQEIVVDVDDTSREIVLVIHWRGGQHSELRVRKPKSGEHSMRASEQADAIIRDMATRFSPADTAATLNRLGLLSGQGNTWTAERVEAYRMKHKIRAYESAIKDGRCLTMAEAATCCGVSNAAIRKLIIDGVLPAKQTVPDAPWQILAVDLERPEVQEALRNRGKRGRPCRISRDDRTLRIPGT